MGGILSGGKSLLAISATDAIVFELNEIFLLNFLLQHRPIWLFIRMEAEETINV